MDLGDYRPILSGLIGGLGAMALAKLWARWIPAASGDKPAHWLLDTYRGTIRFANILLATGLASGIALYRLADFDAGDWRPLALGTGGGCTAALLALTLLPLLRRGNSRDALIAFAIAQRTPAAVLYSLLVCIAALFPAAAYFLLT